MSVGFDPRHAGEVQERVMPEEVPEVYRRMAHARKFQEATTDVVTFCGALVRHGDRWREWYGPCHHDAKGSREIVVFMGGELPPKTTSIGACGIHGSYRSRWLHVDVRTLS